MVTMTMDPRTLALSAVSGLVFGCSEDGRAKETSKVNPTHAAVGDMTATPTASAKKDCCSGKNDCKGKGGCRTASNECAGKNECKGKGGCSMRKCD